MDSEKYDLVSASRLASKCSAWILVGGFFIVDWWSVCNCGGGSTEDVLSMMREVFAEIDYDGCIVIVKFRPSK